MNTEHVMCKASRVAFLLHLAQVKVLAGIVSSVLDSALEEKTLKNLRKLRGE